VSVKKKSEKIFQDLRHRVARNLARLRTSRGFTFEMLGNRAGLHWRHLQKIEAGESNVTLVTIARLADGLAVDVTELMLRAGR
jgi:transcriptional regulator with XRE-family HTH domain